MPSETCSSSASCSESDFSEKFYADRARQYAHVSHNWIQGIIDSSHPALTGETDLLNRLMELTPGQRGLDAGCATARDTYYLWTKGCDVYGIDAVKENIQVGQELHPEIADRLSVANLCHTLNFSNELLDFVICNAVIQHITPEDVFRVTLREFARVLKPGGVLQLMFKNGRGVTTMYDKDYGAERSFQLYDEYDLLSALGSYGFRLVETEDPNLLGGIMYFTDPKPMEHCVFYVRKEAH